MAAGTFCFNRSVQHLPHTAAIHSLLFILCCSSKNCWLTAFFGKGIWPSPSVTHWTVDRCITYCCASSWISVFFCFYMTPSVVQPVVQSEPHACSAWIVSMCLERVPFAQKTHLLTLMGLCWAASSMVLSKWALSSLVVYLGKSSSENQHSHKKWRQALDFKSRPERKSDNRRENDLTCFILTVFQAWF